MNGTAAVLLVNPKWPHNVGNALRACALLGAKTLCWTGERIPDPDQWPEGARLPREERMRCYRRTSMLWLDEHASTRPVEFIRTGLICPLVPVCIEIVPGAEDLRSFEHPEHALYVFGPEDGSVPKGLRHACHRSVRIPTALPDDERTPYNLAASIGLTLYDRLLKSSAVYAAV